MVLDYVTPTIEPRPIHLKKANWCIRDIHCSLALKLCKSWHYTKGGSNTATFAHGLFVRGDDECYGVAWWIPPTKSAAIANFDCDWRRVLSLSRLAINPVVPTNGASFLIGRSIRKIKQTGRWDGLLTYAEQKQNHEGTVYKATNWKFDGMTKKQPVYVNSEGVTMGRKRGGKTLTKSQMLSEGFTHVGNFAKKRFKMDLRKKHHGEFTNHGSFGDSK